MLTTSIPVSRDAVPFRCGGNDALDFVNTVDSWIKPAVRDYVGTFEQLIGWTEQVGLIDARSARRLLQTPGRQANAAHKEALDLRWTLCALFGAIIDGTPPRQSDLKALNALLKDARGAQVLVQGPERFNWMWKGGVDVRAPVLLLALSAGKLLEHGPFSRLKRCPGPEGCGWLFLDESRNQSRRWCSMDYCGSFAKARRFAKAQQQR